MPTTGGAPAPAPPPAPGGGQTPGTPRFPGRLIRQPPMMRGEDVRTWQRGIRDQPPRGQGFWGLQIDGIYGPESQRACRDFQRRERLSVDGIVGPITWGATFRIPARGRPAGR
jgi:peptidoglycan hydrolase-like protein with peptidoglycan-binding domain